MSKGRLEAFSDGVIAIIITIMVLELHTPEAANLHALRPLVSTFLSYALSFVFIGIYWNNHHHILQTARHVDGGVLWANLHFLFWLSLIPFATRWVGESDFAELPMASYGVVLLLTAIGYTILVRMLIRHHSTGHDPSEVQLAEAIGRDRKGWVSLALYVVAIPVAFLASWLAGALFVAVAIIWLIPDRRIERLFAD